MDILITLPPNFKYSIEPPNNVPQYPSSTLCSFAMFDNQFVFKEYTSEGFLPFFTLPKGHIQEIQQQAEVPPFIHYRFTLKSGLSFTGITNIALPPYEFLVPRQLLAEPSIFLYNFDIIRYFESMGLIFKADLITIPFTPSPRDKYDGLLGVHGYKIPSKLQSLRFIKDVSECFRISSINEDFQLCATYPQFLVFPASLTEENIRSCAKFRSSGRLPTLSLHCATASVFRSAEPNFGYFNENSEYMGADTDILSKISDNLIVLDCRPFLNAFANKFQGKGMERRRKYDNISKIEFLGLENIHYLRAAWQELSDLFKTQCVAATTEVEHLSADTPSIFTAAQCSNGGEFLPRPEPLDALLARVERSNWQGQLRLLIVSAQRARDFLTEKTSILLHCSDGWDRTAQMSALLGVIMFPQFRTVRGFLDLIYREFFDFGHRMGSRNGNLLYAQNVEKEMSPVFLLFLDAVREIRQWNRSIFAFSEKLLLMLAFHTKSLMYAGFQSDCARDRLRGGEKMQIFDIILEQIDEYQIDDAEVDAELLIEDNRVSVWWRYWNGGGW